MAENRESQGTVSHSGGSGSGAAHCTATNVAFVWEGTVSLQHCRHLACAGHLSKRLGVLCPAQSS